MKYIKNIPLLLLLLMLSCEQVVEIDLPDYEPEITLSCCHQRDAKIEGMLTKSNSITDSEEIDGIGGATIQLYENDVLFATFEDLGNNYQYQYVLNEPLQAGKRYKITAEAEGLESISASQVMPDAPVFDVVSYTNDSNITIDGREQDIYKIALQDEGGIDNYYEFKLHVSSKYGAGPTWYDYLISYTPYMEKVRESQYLKDGAFDGETYHIELLSNKRDTTIYDLKLEVNAITRDKYLFVKTLITYYAAQDNPFAEPVIVHSNVENGQGVFSLQNSTEWIIE